MARMAGFVFGGLILTIIVIIVAVSPEINLVWFEGAVTNDVKGFFEFFIENIFNTTEIIPFMILASYVKGNFKTSSLWFCIIIGALFLVTTFLTYTVLGNYKETIMFPFYTVAAMAEKTLTERYNLAYIILWVFMAIIKLCLYLITSAKAIRNLFVFKNDTLPLVFSALAVFVLSTIASQKIGYVNAMYSFIISGVPIMLLAVLYPAGIFVANRKKKGQNKGEI